MYVFGAKTSYGHGSAHLTTRKMKRQRDREEEEWGEGENLSRNLALIRIQTT